MAEIGFYHLTRSTLEQALPALLGKTLAAGQRATVMCGDPDRIAGLDAALWRCAEPDWLPHGTAADGDADRQPLWLAPGAAAPNGARYLFLVHGADSQRIGAFDRAFDLFDGGDPDAVQAARRRWTALKTQGHALSYWRQSERGWQRMGQGA